MVCVAESWPISGRAFSSPPACGCGWDSCAFGLDLDMADGANLEEAAVGDPILGDSAVGCTRVRGLVVVRVSRRGGFMVDVRRERGREKARNAVRNTKMTRPAARAIPPDTAQDPVYRLSEWIMIPSMAAASDHRCR